MMRVSSQAVMGSRDQRRDMKREIGFGVTLVVVGLAVILAKMWFGVP